MRCVLVGCRRDFDFFHHGYPFGTAIKTASITWVTGQESYTLPADFIATYRDGILHADNRGRMLNKGLGSLLDLSTGATSLGKPAWYAVVGVNVFVRPLPSSTYNGTTATHYYYSLPAELAAGSVPVFPSDIILVRYVYLRGLEWTRSVQPGSAEAYAAQEIAKLQKAGIGVEAEDDRIALDRSAFPGSRVGSDPSAWMGSPVA